MHNCIFVFVLFIYIFISTNFYSKVWSILKQHGAQLEDVRIITDKTTGVPQEHVMESVKPVKCVH